MKILVPTKRVPDTDQKIRVSDDGISIDDAALPYVINPFDAIALEEALRIREFMDAGAEVLAVGIGASDYEKQLRTALAVGADRVLLVQSDEILDPWNVARILQSVVQRENADLVLMGKQAVDDDANQVGQMLAAMLGWPQATFASAIEVNAAEMVVDRETDAGVERVRVALPSVVTADLRLNEPRYASLPSILKAKKKPIEKTSLAELDVAIEPRVRLVRMETSSSRRRCQMVASADELIESLRNDAEVI